MITSDHMFVDTHENEVRFFLVKLCKSIAVRLNMAGSEVCPHKRNFAAGRLDDRTTVEHSIKNPLASCNSGSLCHSSNQTEHAAVNQTLALHWRGETWHSRSLVGAWTLHLRANDFGVAMDASSGARGYTRKGFWWDAYSNERWTHCLHMTYGPIYCS